MSRWVAVTALVGVLVALLVAGLFPTIALADGPTSATPDADDRATSNATSEPPAVTTDAIEVAETAGTTGVTRTTRNRRTANQRVANSRTATPRGANPPAANASSSTPRIVSVYPNPIAPEDVGEHAVVRFPRATNLSGLTLTDGESNVSLPNRTVSGRVVLTGEPDAAANLTKHAVLGLEGFPALANGGDELRLIRGGTVIDEVAYESAPAGERGRPAAANVADEGAADPGVAWTPLGATDLAAVRTGRADVRAFALPDAPGVALDAIRSTDRRILLAGYTFASERVATALKRAAARGVEVRVLVDDAPAGGITARQFEVLDSLAANGVAVEVVGGERARYDYYHPKYAVADDRALVMTENWKPSGTGGHSNRGWGVVVRDDEAASALADLFRADAGWRDTTAWSTFRVGRTGVEAESADGEFPTRFEPRNFTASSVRVLAAPDNAERAVIGLLDNATESVRVVQAGIGSRRQPFLRAAIRAAERGVDVRILLSSAWYSEEENRAMATWINRRAERGNLSLSAKVAQPNGRFEDIHAKGVLVDGDQVVVGSLNWNNNSARDNREVAVVLSGESVAGYYGDVFAADWAGGRGGGDGGPLGLGDWASDQPLPVGMVVAVAGIIVLALLVARKIRFLE